MKKAVFPGTFDPITIGHMDIVNRALTIFDHVTVAIGINSKKQTLFSIEKRLEWLQSIFGNNPKITCETYEGLTVDYCDKMGIQFIIRGLRSAGDYEYEVHIAQVNKQLNDQIETVFITASPQFAHLSSTVVREVIQHKGNFSPFLPPQIKI